ncbi:MAG: hypothetical protein A2046_15285 [Bacteroidetes bacterium GWA2_30_7]|nr:MAG: hypothetical protein A2046_15285 [Bacteroidetes bacterium GWA2_30_7]
MESFTSKTINSLINVIESNVNDSESKKKAFSELGNTVKYVPNTVFQYSFWLFLFIIILLEFILNTILSGFEPVRIITVGFYLLNALIISYVLAYLLKLKSKKIIKKRLSTK